MRLKRSQAPEQRQRRRRSVDVSNTPTAFSYGGRQNTGRQPAAHREAAPRIVASDKLRYITQRFGTLLLVTAAAASVVSIITLSSTANVTIVREAGAQTVLRQEQAYRTTASQLLAQSVWNRNKITVNTAELREQMLRRFPELQDVTVTVPLFSHRPVFYVQPARAVLILNNKQAAYIVSSEGKAITRAQSVAAIGAPSLPVLTDQGNLEVAVGQRALAAHDVAFIEEVLAQLARKNIAVGALTMPAASNEVDMAIAGQPYFVKYNLQGSAREQVGTFLAVIGRLQSQKQAPSKYVDVRVSGRAYYQ